MAPFHDRSRPKGQLGLQYITPDLSLEVGLVGCLAAARMPEIPLIGAFSHAMRSLVTVDPRASMQHGVKPPRVDPQGSPEDQGAAEPVSATRGGCRPSAPAGDQIKSPLFDSWAGVPNRPVLISLRRSMLDLSILSNRLINEGVGSFAYLLASVSKEGSREYMLTSSPDPTTCL